MVKLLLRFENNIGNTLYIYSISLSQSMFITNRRPKSTILFRTETSKILKEIFMETRVFIFVFNLSPIISPISESCIKEVHWNLT